ncbi:unnamed protein product [Penicillium egyptiacum]|uniref:Nephrocystin 3-like N-terminal domain-containing protein n=1 Tax=Penicillium egyptiacum TaxID=1303716 RepID=A0A9W4KRK2_9EURO|nr:unnamed protein product [Penicillium egyptiacum]
MAIYGINISFFFCQATNSRINNATAVLRGLIFKIVQQQPSLIIHIRYDGSSEYENVWSALLRAFTNILEDPHLQSTYLIMDALDECTTDFGRLLRLLVKQSSAYSHVKWIVSSRNRPSIKSDLNGPTQIKLLELNEGTVGCCWLIHTAQVKRVGEKERVQPQNTGCCVQHCLTSKANGTFLW